MAYDRNREKIEMVGWEIIFKTFINQSVSVPHMHTVYRTQYPPGVD